MNFDDKTLAILIFLVVASLLLFYHYGQVLWNKFLAWKGRRPIAALLAVAGVVTVIFYLTPMADEMARIINCWPSGKAACFYNVPR